MVLEEIAERRVKQTHLQHLYAAVVVLDELDVAIHVRDELAHQVTKLRARLHQAGIHTREEHLVKHKK